MSREKKGGICNKKQPASWVWASAVGGNEKEGILQRSQPAHLENKVQAALILQLIYVGLQATFSEYLLPRFPRVDALQIVYCIVIDDGGERAVQFGNFGFVFIAEGKVKDVQVFRHASGFGGFCQHDDVAFHQPAGNHLRHGFAIFRAD